MNFLLSVIIASMIITPKYDFTEQDVKDLGDAMWLENSHTGKTKEDNYKVLLLTGAVVVNRMRSDVKWVHKTGEHTVRDVIFAKGQYAPKTRNNLGKTDTPQWVYDLAREILAYGTTVPSYVIYQGMNPRLGTLWCPAIAGEYFATEKGHYMEGKNVEIKTNKQKYLRQCAKRINKQLIKYQKEFFKKIKHNNNYRLLTMMYKCGMIKISKG